MSYRPFLSPPSFYLSFPPKPPITADEYISNVNRVEIVNDASPTIAASADPWIAKLRSSRRYAVEETLLRVSWLDAGGRWRMAHASAINISEMGMAFQLPEAPPVLSRVRLRSDKHGLMGKGLVRHCQPLGADYLVGIEFTGSLRWQAPDDPVVEPIPLSDSPE